MTNDLLLIDVTFIQCSYVVVVAGRIDAKVFVFAALLLSHRHIVAAIVIVIVTSTKEYYLSDIASFVVLVVPYEQYRYSSKI